MHFLQGRIRDYAWGSPEAIPAFFGRPPASINVAEIWLGAHPNDPAIVDAGASIFDEKQLYFRDFAASGVPETAASASSQASRESSFETTSGIPLDEWIAKDPVAALGEAVTERYEGKLPYLLKIIAPNEPLSLQVHPSIEQAKRGYRREDAQGIPRDCPQRNYKDQNHKPELVYALSTFEALVGFRAPRRIGDVLEGLDTPLARKLHAMVRRKGVRAAFETLLSASTRPEAEEVEAIARACTARLKEGSPSPRADRVVGVLAQRYPGDPGVVASLLMNPVTLTPGEALFVSAGTIHAYLKGIAVEIMAASDNVLRAGLTPKHVDVPELLTVLHSTASPPTRIAPERVNSSVSTFYAPVDDFELSSIRLKDASVAQKVRGFGPRTVVCLSGAATLSANGKKKTIRAGQAVFVPAADGKLTMRGVGHLVQAAVP